jgi:hypothetical protein
MYCRPGHDAKLATKQLGPNYNKIITFKKIIKKTLEIRLTMSEGGCKIVLSNQILMKGNKWHIC